MSKPSMLRKRSTRDRLTANLPDVRRSRPPARLARVMKLLRSRL